MAALAAENRFDYLLIESSGVSEPMPVAETFTFKDEETGITLGSVAQLDTLVTVVDGSTFLLELDSLEDLRARGWHTDPEDQRSVSHLLCDQVEFANVIVLNKCDLLSDAERGAVRKLLHRFNPEAKVVEASHGRVDIKAVLGTGMFSMAEAAKHEGWLQEARIGEHTPETEEYGIGSFTFRSHRPFHPGRFRRAMDEMKKKEGRYSPLVRAKGFVWLANNMDMQGVMALAGRVCKLSAGPPWWAAVDKGHWPEELHELIKPLWHEPHGDRQQELVMIGLHMQREEVEQALAECLLTDEEFGDGGEAAVVSGCAGACGSVQDVRECARVGVGARLLRVDIKAVLGTGRFVRRIGGARGWRYSLGCSQPA